VSQLGTGLEFVFALVLMLGVLITVHEFGHFVVAKLCGVRVLKFSIGFGPPIGIGRFRMAWSRAGTEYVIAWFPLGGFVKMLGENPDEPASAPLDDHPGDPFGVKATWQKLSVVFAGPAMNLILPVFVFAATLAVGIERRAPVVGTVEPDSPAAAAGIQLGDRIAALDGQPVAWWDEFEDRIRKSPGTRVRLELEREGELVERELEVARRAGLDIFRIESEVGWLGLAHTRQLAVLGIADADAPAARAGLRSGDRVSAVEGRPVADWDAFAMAYAAHGEGEVVLSVARGEGDEEETLHVDVPATGSTQALGAIPAVVLVASVSEDMPAARAGLAPGDLIVAVDGRPIGSFFTFQETVLASGGRALEIRYAREGETREVAIAPERARTGADGLDEEVYLIGIQGVNAILPGVLAIDQVRNPLVSIPRAAQMTVDLTRLFLDGLGRLISGEISRRHIGGPIEIAKQSHMALQAGWERFLSLLVLISINLAIVNLLPIPILDGGQALLIAVEGIKRSPLSVRTREWVQQLGLVLIVALMGFAFWNDLTRHWSSFVEWLRGLGSS
jgi:regulator of sigma E protease